MAEGLALRIVKGEVPEVLADSNIYALDLGALLAGSSKSTELAKALMSLKDLFLVGFFLSIGLSGTLTMQSLLIGALLVPFIFLKSALFFALLTRFKLLRTPTGDISIRGIIPTTMASLPKTILTDLSN